MPASCRARLHQRSPPTASRVARHPSAISSAISVGVAMGVTALARSTTGTAGARCVTRCQANDVMSPRCPAIVRAIAMDGAHDLGASMSKAGQDAGCDSAIRLMANSHHVRMPREQLFEHLPGSVAAMVVDEDRLDLVVP